MSILDTKGGQPLVQAGHKVLVRLGVESKSTLLGLGADPTLEFAKGSNKNTGIVSTIHITISKPHLPDTKQV